MENSLAIAPGRTRLVELTNAGINVGGRWLVRGVDLTIDRGEIVTLVGPNGSGKSTTAKMVLGILSPDEGALARTKDIKVAYVPQKIDIDWTLPLTVRRFVDLTGRLDDEEAKEALSATGVWHLAGEEIRHLSGGELQRVLLARAIGRKPDLLVLDEPVQGVDVNGEIALYELIGKIRHQLACGILLISHDLHIVMAATDKVICLNGHVCCSGSPVSVSESPQYRELFGARASTPTLAVYQHDHDHTHLPDGSVQHSDGSITEHCHPEDGHHGHAHQHSHRHKRREIISEKTSEPKTDAG